MNFTFIPCKLRKLVFSLILVLASISFSFGQNPIVTENALPGTPQSAWDANEGGPIEGFTQEFSVNKGEDVHFKININSVTAVPFTVKIYRIGWYNGDGARFITDLGNSLTGSSQPPYNYDPVTGKVDCSNWAVSATWTVPTTVVSGVYLARFDCPSVGGSSIQLFVVRDDAANTPILFKTSDATWQAYNTYGGNSFYAAATPVPGFSHATKVSYQRPIYIRGDKSGFFNSEYPMIRWLEKNGYNVSYYTDKDMARDATAFTPSIHKILLSVGHDEYYSLEQRNKIETARANGVNVAFFSGNEIYWKTRWEDNYNTLVCYKEGTKGELVCGSKCDPLPNVWTGLWRDGCSPPYAANDGCKPEGAFTGQMSWTQSLGSIKVPDTYKNLRFWKNTTVATLGSGQTATFPNGTLGEEWNPEQFAETYPAHRVIMSYTAQTGLIHKMSLYKYSSGSLIFSAGTMNWAWGLDSKHDLGNQPASPDMKQFTINLLHDMGEDPGSIEAGMVMPTIASDALAPTTTIVSPVHNATVTGALVTVSGTSADNGTGAVAGVEVSTDNGATWNPATGLENWTYTFQPTGYGTITIKVRAWDDLGNVETPGSPGSSNCINISLAGPFNNSVFNSTYPTTTPADFGGGGAVNLGMKFKAAVPGYITGFRYYKTGGVSGAHSGHLWDASGTLLASANFTNETPTGWQSVNLVTPVAINANTTYIVSYFTSNGTFVKQDPFFTAPIVNGLLTGLANGQDGPNGLYEYGATPTFPASNTGSSNYFADVYFQAADITAPQVTAVTPTNGSTGVPLNVQPTATFDENIDPATVTNSTVVMTGPGNVVIPCAVSVVGNVITIIPNSDLAILTSYTVTLSGGVTEPLIKDLSGNALAAVYTWSFTTGGATPPVVNTDPVSQSTCSNSSISFSSNAIGIPTPTVQWQVSTDNGGSWTDVSGATSPTYTFTAVAADNNNQYRAIWTNVLGSDTTAAATLTVFSTISGNLVAVNANICPGDPMQLQLTSATGPAPYSLVINSNTYTGINVGVPFTPIGTSESLWSPTDAPLELLHPDPQSIEVGLKIQSDKNGVIRGVRFYKGGAANGGAHVGSLWSSTGTLLAQATFTGETSSGWQEVLFSTPVSITAYTTYVVSYFLPQGNYSKDPGYFSTGFTNGISLSAAQGSPSDPNAVYGYTNSPAFPDQNSFESNYWVDVVFAPYTTTTQTFNFTSITASNGCSLTGSPISSVTITVSAIVNAGTVTGTTPLCIGQTATYATNGDPGGSWSSTNTLVATVNPTTGLVTAISAGTTDITYTVTGCDGTKNAFKTLTVNPNANAGTVTGSSPLCIGATATYTNNGDAGGVWTSDNILIATVNPATGLVTAVGAGTANIIYTVGCNAVSSAGLTVNPNANPGTVSGTSPLCIGATTIYTSNGDAGGIWSSDNTLVATVNVATGEVTAISAGTANIIYTVTGCNGTASASVTVNPSANAGVVTGATPLCIGATATYTSNGDAGGTWSSTNILVATVNPTSGLVTAVGAGTTDITYTINTGCNTPVSSFKTLTVSPNANAGTVSGASPLCIGATATYTSNGDAGGTWSSDDLSIATVNPVTGLVTAVNTGAANIIYTVGCNATASSQLIVSVNASAGTVTGPAEICIGATGTFTSDGDAGGTWSSTNTLVATVNPATGVVTAVGAGTTNITYTVATGCNNPVSSFAVLNIAAQVSGTITAVNASVCPGSPMQLQLSTATGPSPYNLVINGAPYGPITVGVPFTAVGSSESIWTPGDTPLELSHPDAGPVEVGVKFQADKNGMIQGIRFYKGPGNDGTHVGSLWTSAGTLLAQATFVAETASGWQQVIFSNPVAVTANTTYVASCFLPLGNYSKDPGYFSTSYSNGISLTALDGSGAEANGVYLYTGSAAFPTDNSFSTNYWVDVVFAPYATTTTTFNLTNITASNGCTLSGSPISSATITVSATTDPGTVSGLSPLCIGAIATYTTNGQPGGTWSSTNTAVATVNPTTGQVTAVGAGTTNITYTITGCTGTASAFQPLIVLPDANPGTVSGTTPLCIGATATYTATGADAGGTWSSTNTSVATVNPATGFVTAVGAGTTNITYTLNTGCNSPKSSFQTLTVNGPTNAGTVSGTSPLCIGATATYTSNGDPGGTWSSTNTAVATVNPATGLVTAVSAGTTDITYTVNGCTGIVSAFKTLTVSPNVNAGTVSGTSPLCIGATATYTSNGDAGGTWSSTNTAVATVNPVTGLVTAVAAGTTDITYTINTGCASPVSSFATLTVNANVNAGTVSGTSPLCIGSTATYTSNGDAGGTWSSTNPLVATVDNAGLVTAVAAGTTDITYTINTGCASPVSSFATLTVNANVNAGTVSGTSPLCIGSTATYTSNGDAGGTWSSTNTAVATVNPATGLVTAVAPGTTDITYTVSGCAGPASAFATLTVNANVNAGTVTGTSPLCIGSTATYTSSGDAGGTWTSTNTAVATVNPTSGLVTAVGAGTTDITYTISTGCSSPQSSFQSLTVNPNANAGVVSGPSGLCTTATDTYTSNGDAGGTWSSTNTLVATVNPATGDVLAILPGTTDITYTVNTGCNSPVSSFKTLTVGLIPNAGTVSGTSPLCIGATATYSSDGNGGGTWSSTNTAVATVDANTGLVTAISAGTTDITYTVTGCLVPASSFKTLTVNPNASAGIVSGTSPVCVGNTITYSSNGNAGGTWSSTNTSVATVNSTTGVVTAIGAGTTDITYTVNTGCNNPVSSFKTLTVNGSILLAGVAGGPMVCSNTTVQPSGTYYSDASCDAIATITPSGASPVSGLVNTCVTIEDVVHTYQSIPYVQRHFDIVPATNAANSTATITLYFTQGEFDAFNLARGAYPALPNDQNDVLGIANVRVTQFHGTGTYPGNYTGSSELINPNDNNIVWNSTMNRWEISFDINGFSGFYLFTNPTTPLPITLLNFSGRNNGSTNLLEWTTSSEQNSSYFELQRSTNGANFVTAGTVAAAGNSSIAKNYNYNDNVAAIGSDLYYYRLKMVDITGVVKYSSVVKIRLNTKGFNAEVSPNPFSDQIRINIETPVQENASITLNDVSGKKIQVTESLLRKGSNVITLANLANVPAGVYLLTIKTDSQQETVKVIKQ